MKCIILAAGYATRLYPLTKNFPKPLLEVNGKTILNHLIDDIDTCGEVDEYIVISNHKFAPIFEEWAEDYDAKIIVIDDGTETNETRLGAVKDIKFAVDKLNITDDCLVIAGDNLLDFSLTHFIDYARTQKTSCVMYYDEPSQEKLTKTGVLELDVDLIVDMEEKPAQPKTHHVCPPFYYYLNQDLQRIDEALADGCGYDAPGSLVAWLCHKAPVHALKMPGSRYDIGNLESYENVKQNYKGVTK